MADSKKIVAGYFAVDLVGLTEEQFNELEKKFVEFVQEINKMDQSQEEPIIILGRSESRDLDGDDKEQLAKGAKSKKDFYSKEENLNLPIKIETFDQKH